MHGVVRKHEVNDPFQVNSTPEIFMITPREASADAVVDVHHTRDTVEPETIKFEFLHIEPKIAEEEAENLVASVVEQPTIPQFVLSFRTAMEVEVVCTIKRIKAVKNVLASVRMNNIEQNNYPQAVSCVNEFFQFFGGAVARTCGKETGNLVSKGWKAIIRHSFEMVMMTNYRRNMHVP